MKIIGQIVPILAFALSAASGGEQHLEVRLLKTLGAEPTEKTLQSLVEDPGAQATPMISVSLPESGVAKIQQVTPYRFATEYAQTGEPNSFDTKELGWTGSATVTHFDQDQVNLKLDLKNVRIGTPRVYDLKGIQMTMPTFTAVKIPDQDLALTHGAWRFVKDSLGNETFYWAVRITKQKS